MRVVVVGYGPGGAAAAIAARMFDSESEVRILTEEVLDAHRKPGASLALQFPDTKDLTINDWSISSLAKKRIDVVTGTSVISGNPKSRLLRLKNEQGKSTMKYDRLILATGGIPNIPEIPGTDLPGIFTIQNMADTSEIGRQLSQMNKVVIVGAGFSGLEAAERLISLGKDVHMIVRSRFMRRQLEDSMSDELQSRLPQSLKIHFGHAPAAICGDQHVRSVLLGNELLDADAVLFMTGVRPNTALAQQLGAKTGSLGGILVDEQMQTSVKGIFAVGDCVEMKDSYTGLNLLLPIGSVAARAGRQAGVAAVGSTKIYGDISKRLQYDRIFGNDVVCVGHSSTTAGDLGVKTKVHYVEDPSEFSKVALVTGPRGQLIGGQVIAARQGARLGYEILERVEAKARLKTQPLLKPRHERLRDFLESTFGPIQ